MKEKINPRKILIIARGGIGNLILFLPTLKILRRTFKDAQFSMIVSSNSLNPLLKMYDINEIINFDEPSRRLKDLLNIATFLVKNKFDICLVIYPSGLRSAVIAFFSRAKVRLGFKDPLLKGLGSFFYTYLIKPNNLHYLEENLRILEALGIHNNFKLNPEIIIPIDSPKNAILYLKQQGIKRIDKLIGFHPGSSISQKWKRWPTQYFIELINLINIEQKSPVLIFGNKDETILINDILSKLNGSVKATRISCKNIMESAALISLCKIFIGNDSALIHIASACKIPTICICGPTNIKKSGPYGPDTYMVHQKLKCLFCYDFNRVDFKCSEKTPFKCLAELYPVDVYNQIKPILFHELRESE
jgi:lipopolysaccharide heptosyltransferase II